MKVFTAIIKLLFPPKCIFCNEILDSNSSIDICSKCFSKIPFTDESTQKLKKASTYEDGCDYMVCVCRYSGIIKSSLIHFKFFNKSSYYRTFAALLADRLKKMTNIREFDIIMSVPLYRKRECERGYNQSLLLSRELSRLTGVPDKSGFLERVRHTKSQSLLGRGERYHNVKNAFRVRNTAGVDGKTILLVDDITTTGHTLDECGRILKQAGAKIVAGAVIASGRVHR